MKTGLEDKSEAELATVASMASTMVALLRDSPTFDASWWLWIDAAKGLCALAEYERCVRLVGASR